MKQLLTNREKIDALKELYELKANYHKEELIRNVTKDLTKKSVFQTMVSFADIIKLINKMNT